MKPRSRFILCIVASLLWPFSANAQAIVGSKKFTESIILAEMLHQLSEKAGIKSEHKKEIGGTRILWEAMLRKDIDAYPEYTGTIQFEILKRTETTEITGIADELMKKGIGITQSLGFEDTYSLGMKTERARALGVSKISDLRNHKLAFGLSHEFLERKDGWPGLSKRYAIIPASIRGVDHEIGYRGVTSGATDVIDLYTTDAEISYYGLTALEDDLHYFPEYQAVFVYRLDCDPRLKAVLQILQGKITASEMIRMNAAAKTEKKPPSEIAHEFIKDRLKIETRLEKESTLSLIIDRTLEHLLLVSVSLFFGILVSVPLGYLASVRTSAGGFILSAVGVIQTIPSLALLVFMIPLLGIGTLPALVALFLYSLLPMVRGTYLGFSGISDALRESAVSMGLTPSFQLRRIYWPLALRSVLSGIKISAVINVGVATLGALIGAGGYGQTILKGIRLDDTGLILSGAVPAASMALLVQAIFDLLERKLVSPGLRG